MTRVHPVSIKTVAERAGVSPATVSNVLNGKPSVTPLLARRVRDAVEDLGYAADQNASRLRSGKHSLAGVVVPDLSNPMFGAFVSTLERLARHDGFDLLVVSSANDAAQEAERLRQIRSWRPAGLIVIPCDGALAERLPRGPKGPIVVADRLPDDPAFDIVAVDNRRAAGAMAAHLAAQGYPACLVLGSTLAISNVRERWEGARAEAGATTLELLEVGLEPQGIGRTLRTRLSGQRPPAVVFALDHVTALAAYRVMAELGLRIPGQVGFASFDETEWMRLVAPPVTAVAQPVEAMAGAAWAQLARRIGGDASSARALRLACAIEFRGSTPRFDAEVKKRCGPMTREDPAWS